MNKWQKDVLDFQCKFQLEYHATPQSPVTKTGHLWSSLVREEIDETLAALDGKELTELADGITDSIYVLLGMANAYGININQVWNEVHRTNMLKEGGGQREDGKILKPEGWKPPDILSILVKQGMIIEKPNDSSL